MAAIKALALLLSCLTAIKCACCETLDLVGSETCSNFETDSDYDPNTPRVLCCLVPEQFYTCEEPRLRTNSTNDTGTCTQFGGLYYEDVETTSVRCSVLEGVECSGNRTFLKDSVPCLRYGGHYFPTIMLYSVFLGFLGVDRFCLGYTCIGVAKLLTLGAIGVWWIVDVFLLLTGYLNPEGNYTWEQVY